jgi:CheY-like chemotaxis protein
MLKCILAVEPDPVDRLILEKILDNEQYLVCLTSAREALSFAMSNVFDIAIINDKLINHHEAVGLLQKLKDINPNFISIVTTALSNQTLELRWIKSGFDGVAVKPLTTSILKPIINSRICKEDFATSVDFI